MKPNQILRDIKSKMFKNSQLLVIVYVLLAFVIGISYFTSKQLGIPFSNLTRDTTAVLKSYPFIGLLSNLGALIWCATTVICFFSAFLILSWKKQDHFLFLLSSGLISLVLLVDDFFMFHDWVLPVIMHVPENVTYLVYAVLILSYLFFFRKELLQFNYPVLLLAFFFFAISLSVDHFDVKDEFVHFFEDAPKLVGIATWFVFFSQTSFFIISSKSE